VPNKNNNDSKEFESQNDDDQLLMTAKKTYEHVKIIKGQEGK
jgi:hypothetical protein